MIPSFLFGQEGGKIRLGTDFGIICPKGKVDVLVGAELKYNITNRVSAGVRIEGAGIAKELSLSNGESFVSESRVGLAYITTCSYYFFKHKGLRFFCEGGLGYYQPSSISASKYTNYQVIEFSPKVGVMLKFGIEHDKLRFGIGGQFVPNSSAMIGSQEQNIVNSYFSVSLGYFIGGGNQ